jgi:hypothetical protein
MGKRIRIRPTHRTLKSATPNGMVSTLAAALAVLAVFGCTTKSATADSDRPIQEIENERNPIVESDCLDGEYFDSATESCESVDNQK